MKNFILAAFCLVLLVSCKNNSSTTTPGQEPAKDGAAATDQPKGKYTLKSGVVEYKTTVMGMEAKQTLSFDDYGAKELTSVSIEMMGYKSTSYTLNRDGYIYSYDLEKKTGTKMKAVPQANIDFANLTDEVVKDMKIKKEGEESFLGKTCTKFSIDNDKLSMKGNYLVWNGIPLKTDVDMGSMKMVLEAIKLDENASIPATTFDVPADVKFTDL
jgi:hypothetical protein